jgi:amino acid adenylation domain-containing protein
MTTAPIRLLHETLESAAGRQPNKIAVHTGDRHITFHQLNDAATRLAACMQSRGLKRGERAAIFMDNTPECVISIYAILKAGGVFVVINPQTKSDKLRFMLNDCSVRHLLTDSHLATIANDAIANTPSLSLVIASGDVTALAAPADVAILGFQEAIAAEPAGFRRSATIPLDLAALIYTSGSTGNPKGVMQTHQSMVFAIGSLTEYLRLASDDVLLNVLPLAFDYGLYQLLMTIQLIATLVLERSFAYPAEVLKRISSRHVTVFPGVPTVFAILLAAHAREPLRFPDIRRVTNTAAALPAEYVASLYEIFPNALVFAMYGLTECKRVSYLEPELIDKKPGCVGRAIPGTEVFLLTPDGARVPHGEPGILHVRGPHVMLGYWNSPEQTAKMLCSGLLPGERMLCTGDWFRMDEEGFLYFVGRSDDIIKTRGEKVSPAEVESALYKVGGIQEAVVIGVADDVLGQAVRAYVVLSPGTERDERRIRRGLMQQLENFMMPRDIVFMETLPKSPNGKVARKELP